MKRQHQRLMKATVTAATTARMKIKVYWCILVEAALVPEGSGREEDAFHDV